MEDFHELKKRNYGEKVVTFTEDGIIDFDPDGLKKVVGAGEMTYDEYLDIQICSLGTVRRYFQMCYFNVPMEFKGQVEKCKKDTICFKRIYISGMYPDGEMFEGKEDHVWMEKAGLETAQIGECFSFSAEVYRYIKTGKGKQIDYALRNPVGIKKIMSYELPSDNDLMMAAIDRMICDVCCLNEQCNKNFCMLDSKKLKQLKLQIHKIVKS